MSLLAPNVGIGHFWNASLALSVVIDAGELRANVPVTAGHALYEPKPGVQLDEIAGCMC